MTTLFCFDELLSKEEKSIFEEVHTLPINLDRQAAADLSPASELWHAITKMLSPLEYLLFNINMVFLADSYFEYDCI